MIRNSVIIHEIKPEVQEVKVQPEVITHVITEDLKVLDIPTKTSDLTNDSGFITSSQAPVQPSDVPTKTSDLTNDSGFITSSQAPVQPDDVPTTLSELSIQDISTDNSIPEGAFFTYFVTELGIGWLKTTWANFKIELNKTFVKFTDLLRPDWNETDNKKSNFILNKPTIQDPTGATMPRRGALQFKGGTVTDDEANNRTIFEAQGGGGGGGHIILNNGIAVEQRAKLDVVGATFEDDADNDTTRMIIEEDLSVVTYYFY